MPLAAPMAKPSMFETLQRLSILSLQGSIRPIRVLGSTTARGKVTRNTQRATLIEWSGFDRLLGFWLREEI
jgi:hypothetical protein